MSEITRYDLESGSVLVEVEDNSFGIDRVARGDDNVINTGQRLETALGSVGSAAQATLRTLTKLGPETLELEFGIKFAGEAGAIIAKASSESQFTVRMSWSRNQ
ncbi:CU044_2847 family protein [Kocuria sabuli]|uniref:CU044_2847 family protein n=1 Tax=Kocuria sabuli TaxID=3071448 RepID=UPI0034D447B7